jgi:serine/threonine protein kinase/tetratricopeptide (TPR) repeat protein
MGEQFNQAKSIFLAAIDEHAPEQWPTFLDQACAGDDLLRTEVERLLRSQAALGSFHEAPRFALPAAVDELITERPGTIIGPYKLLEQLGEGGFGIVFLAEQQGPIRRQVALKVLKPGMDTRQVLARFDAERQALALMDHPHIARVLDAGATSSGRPYFVMELVMGESITEYCDRNRLAPEARLKLFIDVCQAIQHAHHKGVIHRDIKPANVLVTQHDGPPHPTLSPAGGEGRVRGVVKVIDFGVAKATAQRLTERTLFTADGQMIGTPAYMSPEQAEMGGLDIDTRSDVYGLGVLLYELLTGTTPLEGERLQEAGYVELLRLIREEEAPRPCVRLSAQGDAATVLAGNRGLDVKRLAQLLAGDLDWVVLKALEKDRNRRYDTPATFAEDVERYLRREPIRARPPSTVYKVKKFAQRHRAAVLTGAAVAAAVLVGAAVATWQAVVATWAKQEALAAAGAEKAARELAQAREAETKVVLEFVENQVLAAARPEGWDGGRGHAVTLRQAVEAALPFVDKSFTHQPLIEARLRMTLGHSFWCLGDTKIAADQFQIARTLYTRYLGPDHPETLRSMHNLAQCYHVLGRYADALRLKEETLARRKARLGPDHPDTRKSISSLAAGYHALGRRAEALKLCEETLAWRKARLGPDHPDTLTSMHNLAVGYRAAGRHAEALKVCEATLAGRKARLGPDHPDTLASIEDLAHSYHALGRHADAFKLFADTLARRKAKLGPDHPDTLKSMYNLANSYHALGRPADALKLHEETLALRKAKLGPDHRCTLSSMGRVAASLAKLGRGAEAVPIIDECVRRSVGKPCCRSCLLPAVLGLRLRHFEETGDAAGCRQTAAMWESLKRTDAGSLYTAARMRAVTAAVLRGTEFKSVLQAEQADAEADRAMAWLKQAVAAGYKNVAHMKQDWDLDALRDRADFTKLLTRLEVFRD